MKYVQELKGYSELVADTDAPDNLNVQVRGSDIFLGRLQETVRISIVNSWFLEFKFQRFSFFGSFYKIKEKVFTKIIFQDLNHC